MHVLVRDLLDLWKCVEGDRYAKLKSLFEGINIVDWPFQFLYVESGCRINCKLNNLNKLFWMYMLLLGPKLESGLRMHVVDLDFVYDSQPTLECIVKETKSQHLTLLMTLIGQCLHKLVIALLVRALTMWHLI